MCCNPERILIIFFRILTLSISTEVYHFVSVLILEVLCCLVRLNLNGLEYGMMNEALINPRKR
jgi:hypothetical protein